MKCPHCQKKSHRNGKYWVRHKRTYICRSRCRPCSFSFSSQTFSPTYRQRKTQVNWMIFSGLSEGLSLLSLSRVLRVSYSTVYRRFEWLALLSKRAHEKEKLSMSLPKELQFDDMISIEHTKLKPLAICLVVTGDYKFYAANVCQIPVSGRLAKISRKKYGSRKDMRKQTLTHTLKDIKSTFGEEYKKILFKSDMYPTYRPLIKKNLPMAQHLTFKRAPDEKPFLKYNKKHFDPLFALNQRCALVRSSLKRMTRRSWCTTKKMSHLQMQLDILIAYKNGYQLNI